MPGARRRISPSLPATPRPCARRSSSLRSTPMRRRMSRPAFARAGKLVLSNARNYRMDADVPLLIPEVNPDHLELLPIQRASRRMERRDRHELQLLDDGRSRWRSRRCTRRSASSSSSSPRCRRCRAQDIPACPRSTSSATSSRSSAAARKRRSRREPQKILGTFETRRSDTRADARERAGESRRRRARPYGVHVGEARDSGNARRRDGSAPLVERRDRECSRCRARLRSR